MSPNSNGRAICLVISVKLGFQDFIRLGGVHQVRGGGGVGPLLIHPHGYFHQPRVFLGCGAMVGVIKPLATVDLGHALVHGVGEKTFGG